MDKNISVSITEVTVVAGKKKYIRVEIDGETVKIPVDETVFAFFQEQFLRKNPTEQQKKRFATLMNIVRAAYKQGKKDAS